MLEATGQSVKRGYIITKSVGCTFLARMGTLVLVEGAGAFEDRGTDVAGEFPGAWAADISTSAARRRGGLLFLVFGDVDGDVYVGVGRVLGVRLVV